MSPKKTTFTFSLYGQPVKVDFSDPKDWSDDAMGRANSRNWLISIADNLTPAVEINVLLHEMIHMICDTQDVKINEQAVTVVANGLLDIFNNNPEMLGKVFGEPK